MDADEVHADLAGFEARRIAYGRVPASREKLNEALDFIDHRAEDGAYRRYGLWAEVIKNRCRMYRPRG